MRKKYLSALLFGALLFASAGTFTSCKDYDDDINGLRTEITDLKSAITELQNAVQNGKYVTAVSGNGNVITFTFSDGTTTPITVETESGETAQTLTIGEDGELIINGEGTGYYATTQPTEAEVETGLTKQQNGTWWVLGEDGEYTDTKIPVSGISVSGSEAEGYTFVIYDETGTPTTVELPSVASAITSITLANYSSSSDKTEAKEFGIADVEFNISTATAKEIKKASEWPGNKTLPNDGDHVYSANTPLEVRIDPVSADVSNLTFYLTNTQNDDLDVVELEATANSGDPIKIDNIQGRASNQGNGLWTLAMPNTVVAKDNNKAISDEVTKAQTENWAYALNAAHAARSLYGIKITHYDPVDFDAIYMTQKGGETTGKIELTRTGVVKKPFKVGTPVEVLPWKDNTEDQAPSMYDMYLEASDAAVAEYGLTFDNDNYTFTIGKNPDISTIDASFDLIVWAIDNKGNSYKRTINVPISTIINEGVYTLQTHDVGKKPDDNHFTIDLATMKTALGDRLNQWTLNVDLKNGFIFDGIYTKEDCSDAPKKGGFSADVVEAAVKNSELTNKATDDAAKANYIQVNVKNADVEGLELGKTYYFKFTFNEKANNKELNTVVVPVQFTAPTLASQFVQEPSIFTDNVAMAYMYAKDMPSNSKVPAYVIGRAFNEMPTGEGVKLALSTETDLLDNKYSSANLARVGVENGTGVKEIELTDKTAIYLNNKKDNTGDDIMMTDNSGRQLGYGQELTITATDKTYGSDNAAKGWKYADKNGEYTFKMKLVSPIYEGKVVATNDVITISTTDQSGYKITNKDIMGYAYNSEVEYDVLPTVWKSNDESDWKRDDIAKVTAKSENDKVLQIANDGNVIPMKKTTVDGKDVYSDAYLKAMPQQIDKEAETNIAVTVEDVWGYKKTSQVPVKVTITKGE